MVTWGGEEILTTPRLSLRTFRGDDLAHYAALNADPEALGGWGADHPHSDSIAEWAQECYERERARPTRLPGVSSE